MALKSKMAGRLGGRLDERPSPDSLVEMEAFVPMLSSANIPVDVASHLDTKVSAPGGHERHRYRVESDTGPRYRYSCPWIY